MRRLSSFAIKILVKLQKGSRAVRIDQSCYRVGRTNVPMSVIDELQRNDLISSHPDRGLCLSEPGIAYLRRRDAVKTKRSSRGSQKVRKGVSTSFAQQHQKMHCRHVVVDGRRERYRANIGDTAIGWLAGRKDRDGKAYIEPEMLEAALRFQKDCELGGFGRIATSDPAAPPSDRRRRLPAEFEPGDHNLDARKRIGEVMQSLGPVLSDLLIRTCCFGHGLEQIEVANSWPRRSGKLVLQIALERLVDHYNQPRRSRSRSPQDAH